MDEEEATTGSSFAGLDARLPAAVLASIANAVAITDTGGVIRWVNAAFTQMSGYTAAEALGQTPRLLKSGVQDDAFYTQLWSTILDGRTWQGELVNRHRSGRLYTVRQTITPIVDPCGAVTHFVAVHGDVTAQRQVEAERDLQVELVEAVGVAVIVTDLEGKVTFWNTGAEQLYGWSRREVLGRNILEVNVTPGANEQAVEIMATVRSGGSWSDEFEVRRRDGTTFVALVTDTPYVDASGQLAGIIGVSTDVTELRQAQQQAQMRASQQAAVARLGRRALTDLDLDSLFDEAVNTVATELDVPLAKVLELSSDQHELLLTAGVGWRDGLVGHATVPNDRRSQAGYTLLQDRAVIVNDLATETRFDGPALLTDHGVVAGTSTSIRSAGRDYGILAAHTTVPRSFTADDTAFLDALAAVLGAAIMRGRIEAELQTTVDRLARSDEIRTAFLRATSHELRTPLTAIDGFAQTLEDRDTDLDPEQRRLLLSRLRANTGRLARLVTDLLDVDRLSSGLATANRQPHDLNQLVRRVIDEQDLAGRHLELDLDTVRVEIDPPKFERAMANLIANAVRHTPTGATIHIGLHRQTDATMLVVANDGPGIDPDYLDQIFEPFVQGPERHHAPQPGTGLGLSLVRELITLHNGTITAHNRPEGGARFEITLPNPAATPPPR